VLFAFRPTDRARSEFGARHRGRDELRPPLARTSVETQVHPFRRQAHPITSLEQAQHNRLTICQVRGYCGPFINQQLYDSFPDPIWRGSGECVVCCDTRNVQEEEAKQAGVRGLIPLPPAHQA
jgi:hypothetical protein